MSLIPRIHSPHTREPVDKCSSPLSSAIIMIVIVSRGIIKLCYAKINVVTSQSKPLVNTTFLLKTVVSTFLRHSTLSHPLTVRAALRLSTCTDLDTTVAWNRAAPGARRKPTGHLIKEGFVKLEYTQ